MDQVAEVLVGIDQIARQYTRSKDGQQISWSYAEKRPEIVLSYSTRSLMTHDGAAPTMKT